MSENIDEQIYKPFEQIKHTGFCLGKMDKTCITECPMFAGCIELYKKERSENCED